jgi:hypothetical protein
LRGYKITYEVWLRFEGVGQKFNPLRRPNLGL